MASPGEPSLLIVGVNHRSAGMALREALFVEEERFPERLAELRDLGLREAMLLSTCDRVEVVAAVTDPERQAPRLRRQLAQWASASLDDLEGQSYSLAGHDALRHLFAVAASLDSQVIGEPQVLGQVKESHRLAAELGLTGSFIEAALQAAYGAAKRVRSETPLAEQPVTLAASALRVARDLHGRLEDCSALLLGLGEMGELLAGELRAAGVGELAVSHRFEGRAEAAARRLRAHLRPWDDLDPALAAADIVITAVGSGRFLLDRQQMERALRSRRRRPIFVIDAAVPKDVEPAVEDLDGAFVYALDDLERVAARGRRSREGASMQAWRVLGEELEAFRRSRAERAAGPLVSALRDHAERLRLAVLADGSMDAEQATRLLLARLLHEPSEALRRAAAEDPAQREEMESLLRRLFGLERGVEGDEG